MVYAINSFFSLFDFPANITVLMMTGRRKNEGAKI